MLWRSRIYRRASGSGFRSEGASAYAALKPPGSMDTFAQTINTLGCDTQPVVDHSGDNERPAGDQLVPRARDKLVRGKPLVRGRLVIKPDTVHGDAEARIDVIDDGAPVGSNNINGIA